MGGRKGERGRRENEQILLYECQISEPTAYCTHFIGCEHNRNWLCIINKQVDLLQLACSVRRETDLSQSLPVE